MPSQTLTLQIIIHPDLMPFADVPALLEKLANFEPILETMAEFVQDYQKQNWADDGGVLGDGWAPLAPSTLKEKRRRGYPDKTLLREGTLRDEVGATVLLNADSVTVGINLGAVPYAIYHDSPEQGSRLPQRILVAVSAEMVDDLVTLLREWLSEGTGHAAEGIEILTELT